VSGVWRAESLRVADHIAYRAVRLNIRELATPGTAGEVVPACPEWTVQNLVAHLAGNCASTAGTPFVVDGVGLAGLLAGWDVTAQRVETMAANGAVDIGRLLMDAFTHELDLRDALGVGVPVDHPAYPPAFDVLAGGLSWSISMRGLPALRLVSEDSAWVAGPGKPVATVTAGHYDLYRSLSGRRTPKQIADLQWSADPSRWLPAFFWGPFAPPE
jgi:uncharacterized protein (TIGR03083 family)